MQTNCWQLRHVQCPECPILPFFGGLVLRFNNAIAYLACLQWPCLLHYIEVNCHLCILSDFHCLTLHCNLLYGMLYTSPHLDVHQSHPDPLIAPWCFIRLIRVIWIHLKLVRLCYCVQLHALRRFRSPHWEQLSRLVCGVQSVEFAHCRVWTLHSAHCRL